MKKLKRYYLSILNKKGTYFSQFAIVNLFLKRYSLGHVYEAFFLKCFTQNFIHVFLKSSLSKFLFCSGTYETTFFCNYTFFFKRKNLRVLFACFLIIKWHYCCGDFLTGCILKKVKGGFSVDLGGLLCFMPLHFVGKNVFSSSFCTPNNVSLFIVCVIRFWFLPCKL
jgi:hypothetical protein